MATEYLKIELIKQMQELTLGTEQHSKEGFVKK
jgi:hypothetical protein